MKFDLAALEEKEIRVDHHFVDRFYATPMRVSQKRGRTTMKIGDRFKDKITGKIYIFRMETDNNTIFLQGENGLGRRLTGKNSLKQTCEKLEDIKD